MKLYQILFPSWRFFENTGTFAKMYYRCGSWGSSDWKDPNPPIRRQWWHVFFNPQGNQIHTCQNKMYQLITESQNLTSEKIENLDSYLFLKGFISAKLKNPGLEFQFKFVEIVGPSEHDIFVSAVHQQSGASHGP